MTAPLADALRAAHVPGKPLVLPNAWDAASARAVVAAGFEAVATASAAVAPSLGYDDHEATPPEEMFAAVTRIARAVDVPVTADLERGYGLQPAELAERLLASGAVGCNLEDTDPNTGELVPVEEQAELLAGVRRSAPDVVINARADVFLRAGSATAEPDEALFAEAVRRGRAYVEVGADCIYLFAIHGLPLTTFRRLGEEIGAPINVAFLPELGASVDDLAAAGVARISFGPGLFMATQSVLGGLLAKVRAGENPYAGMQLR